MARGKAQKKSSMRGKRGLLNNRAIGEREMGKKVAGQAGRGEQTRRKATADQASKTQDKLSRGTRRPRKSDI